MGNRQSAIKPLSQVKYPAAMLFFDTETFVTPLETGEIIFPLRLGVAIYHQTDNEGATIKREVNVFYTQEGFLDILDKYLSKKRTLYVYAHNIGFDIRVLDLPRLLQERGVKSEPPIINSRVFIWDTYHERGKITWLDTGNYGVISVAKLGSDLGFPKGEVNFETATDEELLPYCQRDCEILERFILDFKRLLIEQELGGMRNTLASQAFATFRTCFLSEAIALHNDPDILALERQGYYGGRTETFFIGALPEDHYWYLDINSMYPYVMKAYHYPVKLLGYSGSTPQDYLRVRIKRYYCIADVTLKTDKAIYPLRHKHKLCFPLGTFRTTLHHAELEQALNRGHILQVHRVATYEKRYLFGDYVDTFYAMKARATEENNRSKRLMTKLLLNSLYGKFGQMGVTREHVADYAGTDIWRQTIIVAGHAKSYVEFGWFGGVYQEIREGESTYSFPAIAGAVTSYARTLLYSYYEQIGGEHVFYMDTDSLVVDRAGYEAALSLLDEVKLGALKVEDEADTLTIYGLKDYEFGEHTKLKGVPKNALQTKPGAWEYMQFQGFITWLNEGGSGPPKASQRVKHRRSTYDKGIVTPSGRVTPLVFEEERGG